MHKEDDVPTTLEPAASDDVAALPLRQAHLYPLSRPYGLTHDLSMTDLWNTRLTTCQRGLHSVATPETACFCPQQTMMGLLLTGPQQTNTT
jgi:hypothetical protein